MKYKNCPVHFEAKEFELKNIFKISRGSKSKIRTLELRITKNHNVGRVSVYLTNAIMKISVKSLKF